MTAICVSIAEACKDMLNAASLSQKFCAERSYSDWDLELTGEEAEKLHVDVCASVAEQTATHDTRGSQTFNVPVDIAVRYKFRQSQRGEDTGRIRVKEVDDLVLLVEEIFSVFVAERLTDFDEAVWVRTEIRTTCDRLRLKTSAQFLGVVRVTFNADKVL